MSDTNKSGSFARQHFGLHSKAAKGTKGTIKREMAQLIQNEAVKSHAELSEWIAKENALHSEIHNAKAAHRQKVFDLLYDKDTPGSYRRANEKADAALKKFIETPEIKAKITELSGLKSNIDTTIQTFEKDFVASAKGKQLNALGKALTKAAHRHGPGSGPALDAMFNDVLKDPAHAELLKEFPSLQTTFGKKSGNIVPDAGQTVEAAEGLWTKFTKLHSGKQAAIVGGAAAVVGAGYWALKTKSDETDPQKTSGPSV